MGEEREVLRVYLAGGFMPYEGHPDWRDYVIESLADEPIAFYDPRTDTEQGATATFVSQDLAGVEGSHCVFYFLMRTDGDPGATAEFAHGNAKGRLCILCVNEGIAFIHPFVAGISRRLFIGLHLGTEYLRNLAHHGIDEEFKAIYETIGRK
jgi:hypothetical protein